jgi:arsenite-transporting ATPase
VSVTRAEAARTSAELQQPGVSNQRLAFNGVYTARDQTDPVARALQARGREALRASPEPLRDLPSTTVPLLS